MSISLGGVAWLLVPSVAVVQCRIATLGSFGRVDYRALVIAG